MTLGAKMNTQQSIETIAAFLLELSKQESTKYLIDHFYNVIGQCLCDEKYFEIFDEIDGKYKRAEVMERYVKEFAERIQTAREMEE